MDVFTLNKSSVFLIFLVEYVYTVTVEFSEGLSFQLNKFIALMISRKGLW